MGKKIGLALLAVPALSLASAGPAAADDPLKDQGSASGGAGAQAAKNITVLRKGDYGRAVARVQRKLRISADGVFGSQTTQGGQALPDAKGPRGRRRGGPQDPPQDAPQGLPLERGQPQAALHGISESACRGSCA